MIPLAQLASGFSAIGRTFAHEPEERKVGADARVTIEGVAYEVEPDLAGERVVLW